MAMARVGADWTYGTGAANIKNISESKDYAVQIDAVNGLGEVTGILYGSEHTTRTETNFDSTLGTLSNSVTEVEVTGSNEDFIQSRVTTETWAGL